jgi:hypothetical protein
MLRQQLKIYQTTFAKPEIASKDQLSYWLRHVMLRENTSKANIVGIKQGRESGLG